MSNKSQSSIVKQAGVLVIAGIFVKIIGILYRSPLTSLIGDEGNGYYSSAYNIYLIILMLSSYNIPAAISKLLSEKLAKQEYRNAQKVFYASLIYVMVMGVIASLILYFGAELFVGDNASGVLKVFAPTIILFGPLGALRGYFQARHTMTPTSVSQIFEQIANAGVSILAAFFFTESVAGFTAADRKSAYAGQSILMTASSYMLGESSARGTDTLRAIKGATGSALGTGCGVLAALIVMLIVYLRRRKTFAAERAGETKATIDSYGEIFKRIILMVTPMLLSNLIYNICNTLNQSIYFGIERGVFHMAEADSSAMYGVYSGKASLIVNVPIAIAAAMSSVMIPTVSAAHATGKTEEIKEKTALSIRVTMLVAIPSAAGLFALARPVTQILFPQKESLDLAASLLRVLAITVVFFSISTITNGVLQGIGKVNKPVINATISLVLQSAVLTGLLLFSGAGLYALAVASIIYSGAMVLLNSRNVSRELGYTQEMKKTFILPAVSSLIMGVFAYFSYKLMYMLVPSNTICLVISIVLSVFVYFIVLIKIGGATKKDLLAMPKGHVLVKLLTKIKLL